MHSRPSSSVSDLCATWLIRMCDMTHSDMWHDSRDSFRCITGVITHDRTHSHIWHDSFRNVTWLIQICDRTYVTHSDTWQESLRMIGLIHIYDMTHSDMWHDLFRYVTGLTWLIQMHDRSHCAWCIRGHQALCQICVRHDSFGYVTWLIHVCDMTYSDAWHDSFRYMTCVCVCVSLSCSPKRSWFRSLSLACSPTAIFPISPCDMTLSHVWLDSLMCVTSYGGVATISMLLKIIGLFCKRSL